MEIEEVLEAVRERQQSTGLNKALGIHIVSVDEQGGATVEAELTDSMLNPLGIAHGGTVYTLCDVAAGTAAASRGRIAVTLDSNIHYYRPGNVGTKLTAVAHERKYGRNTSVYMVELSDSDGKRIADATFTMFYSGLNLDAGKKDGK